MFERCPPPLTVKPLLLPIMVPSRGYKQILQEDPFVQAPPRQFFSIDVSGPSLSLQVGGPLFYTGDNLYLLNPDPAIEPMAFLPFTFPPFKRTPSSPSDCAASPLRRCPLLLAGLGSIYLLNGFFFSPLARRINPSCVMPFSSDSFPLPGRSLPSVPLLPG